MAGDMKASGDCYACLRRLAYQAAGLATEDARLRKKAVEEGLTALEDNFSTDKVSIVIATRIHNVIKQITGNPDPYKEVKKREIEIAKRLYHDRRRVEKEDFADCLRFAAWGNTMDFFKQSDSIEEDMVKPVSFVVDDSEHFERKVMHGGRVLYLADNAGEVYFDLPLVKWLGQHADVVYVVKPSPIQNDVTLEDLKEEVRSNLKGNGSTTLYYRGRPLEQHIDELVEKCLVKRGLIEEPLKPCPFCGNEAKLISGDNGEYRVWCDICEAEATWFLNEGTAIEAWNRRV